MVIRYRGTSPKLGSCQGECPYPCDYILLLGKMMRVVDDGSWAIFSVEENFLLYKLSISCSKASISFCIDLLFVLLQEDERDKLDL